MQRTNLRVRVLRAALLGCVLAAIVAIPSAIAVEGGKAPEALLEHLSQSVTVSYYAQHPDAAPGQLKQAVSQLSGHPARFTARSSQYCGSNANKDVFNCDFVGLPQNEESIGTCPSDDNLVLGGTNDYNGLVFS